MTTATATTITRPTGKNLQPALQEFADNRRFAGPVTPYKRGFDDCCYNRVYANPYTPHTVAAQSYDAGMADGNLARAQAHGLLCPDETQRLDALLKQRGLTAEVERVSLATGAVSERFTIGKVPGK